MSSAHAGPQHSSGSQLWILQPADSTAVTRLAEQLHCPNAIAALKEAEERRAQSKSAPPREHNGRGGLDPVRYGDWEVKGLASDF